MKKTVLILGLTIVLQGCSGIATEAQRDENNELLKPSFLDQDQSNAIQEE